MGRMWIFGMLILPAAIPAAAAPLLPVIRAESIGGEVRTPPGASRGYRLLSPGPTAAMRRPVVVWLHPGGGRPLHEYVEDVWPRLRPHGVFLLLPRTAGGGRLPEDGSLLKTFLADAAANFPIDTGRVILLGAGAGGQTALSLGRSEDFGLGPSAGVAGVITFGAYPVKSASDLALSLPPDSCKDRTALLLMYPARSAGARVCRAAEDALAAKGFSVRSAGIAGAGDWPAEASAAAAEWIGQIAAGKRPAPAPLTLSAEARKAAEAIPGKLAAVVGLPAEPLPKEIPVWADPARGLSVQPPAGWRRIDPPGAGALAEWSVGGDPAGQVRLSVRETAGADDWDGLLKARRAEFALAGVRWELVGAADVTAAGRAARLTVEHVRLLRPDPRDETGGVVEAPSFVVSLWLPADGGPAAGRCRRLRVTVTFPSGGKPEQLDALIRLAGDLLRTVRFNPPAK